MSSLIALVPEAGEGNKAGVLRTLAPVCAVFSSLRESFVWPGAGDRRRKKGMNKEKEGGGKGGKKSIRTQK